MQVGKSIKDGWAITPLTELLIALCEVTVNNKYEMSTQPVREYPPRIGSIIKTFGDSGHLLGWGSDLAVIKGSSVN
jgi:hypothetical protein